MFPNNMYCRYTICHWMISHEKYFYSVFSEICIWTLFELFLPHYQITMFTCDLYTGFISRPFGQTYDYLVVSASGSSGKYQSLSNYDTTRQCDSCASFIMCCACVPSINIASWNLGIKKYIAQWRSIRDKRVGLIIIYTLLVWYSFLVPLEYISDTQWW